jgi:F-type H+-transporting ATPase subunit epsilon
MAHQKFPVEVFTADGSIGILANHTPLLATLNPTELRLYKSESDVVRFAQAEGYLQVGGNRAMILVEEAHDIDGLDAGELRERLQAAEKELDEAGEDSERQRVANRDKRRWETFLKIAEGG